MTFSHYLPAFTTRRQRVQMAACGTFINPEEHSQEPTCARCKAWLDADTEEAAALAKLWDLEAETKRNAAKRTA
jgi:uncharacterized paraquat-inducible protein A